MSSPVSGEHHERAVEAATLTDPAGAVIVGERFTKETVDAYHRSLAEQGVRLVDLREVVEWLRNELAGALSNGHADHSAIRRLTERFERRFGSVSE